jgi:hypothetical protein
MDINAVLELAMDEGACRAKKLGITDGDLNDLNITPDNPEDLDPPLIDATELYLDGNPLTSEGLRKFAPLRQLQEIHLWDTGIDDVAIEFIVATFSKLRYVAFGNVRVTAKGLALLVALTALETLELGEVGATHADIVEVICRLPHLKVMWLSSSHSWKSSDVEELQRRRPELKIIV